MLSLVIIGRIIRALRALILLAILKKDRTSKAAVSGLSSATSYYRMDRYKQRVSAANI